MDDSDAFLLCEFRAATGSRFSTRGDPRLDDGEDVLKGLVKTDGGVGREVAPFDGRLASAVLQGAGPLDVTDGGVVACDLLVLELNTRGVGEAFRSPAGDLGGTCGGSLELFWELVVSTLSAGLGDDPALKIGDNCFPEGTSVSDGVAVEGPVTHAIMASPNGPALQLVPGEL